MNSGMRNVVYLLYLFLLCQPLQAMANPHEFNFPKDELAIAAEAIEAIRNSHPKEAITKAARLKNATIKQVVEWAIYKSPESPVSAEAILSFANDHSHWPEQDGLALRAEEAFLRNVKNSDANRDTIIAFFEKNAPQTSTAKWRFGDALHLKNHKNPHASALVIEAYISAKLSREDAAKLCQQYQSTLTREHHVARIENLLWENKISASKDILPLVSKQHQSLFNARIALQQSSSGVYNAVAAVPATLKQEPGFIYDRVRWREKKDLEESAITLLKTIEDTGKLPYSHLWWNLRKRLIRDALERKHYQSAYNLAAKHRATEGGIEFAESEWLAGWVAARFLRDPRTGYEHFYKMYHHVSYPISLARAAYWAGKTARINGNDDIASRWFKLASSHTLTFYGQLALTELSDKPTLKLPAKTSFSSSDETTYRKSDLVKAIHALIQMEELDLAQNFIIHAIKHFDSAGMRTLISQIGQHYKQAHLSVYAARTADQEGTTIIQNSYPLLPADYQIHTSRELAQGITLQESRFESRVTSHAGAQGLMQLMPATARRMARSLHLHYRRSKLVYDPAYNVRLGSQYLKHLLEQYDNAPVLAIAAYNAGPGNVRKWVKNFGDPRTFETVEQVVDWIELIPFAETRNYVQRVLENKHVYRSLKGEETLLIKNDLVSRR